MKKRLDVLLLEKGLSRSREEARRLILAGRVLVNGHRVDKAGQQVPVEATIVVHGPPSPYVSRGGLKLEAALQAFAIQVTGKVALDVGASTGGFTDCLLQHGARKVYALDVGYGQLDWKLRTDPRVVVMEKVNVRTLSPDTFPEKVDLVTIDVSFISLTLVLPVIRPLLRVPGEVLALVKPQFEVGKGEVGKGGVVRDPAKHQAVIQKLVRFARDQGFSVEGVLPSPLLGPKGNREFFLWLR
ncbi:MAG: TlyA family RNA methyltransferase [Nitrospinota bacterium]|nr:MAG: TlyA family RNA methyltransferase [Nitrospinota bacterium]